jgi:hypothetical protein
MNKKNIAIESAVIVDIHQESEKGFVRINGTYLSPEEKYYVLKYKIPFSGKDQFHYANISTFIREYYLPKIQRERMSSKLLEEINQRIANLMLDVVTQDFDEYGAVSINATYLPLGFDSLEDYLRIII